MKQVIYADVLVALNVLVSFLIIKSACAVSRENAKTYRVLTASFIGGVYSLVIFLPRVNSVLGLTGRALLLSVLTFTVVGLCRPRRFFRFFSLLCAFSLLTAGAAFGVKLLVYDNAVTVRNGSFYIDVGFLEIVLICASVYVAAKLFAAFLARKSSEKTDVRVVIRYGEKTVKTKGIIDSGNTLCDSFTGEPVSVISQEVALALLPTQDAAAAISPMSGDVPEGMHLVVSDTVGKSALLCAFKADSMALISSGDEVLLSAPTLAVSPRESFASGNGVLVNSVYINDIQGGRECNENHQSVGRIYKGKAEKERNILHKRARNSTCAADERAGERGDAKHRVRR